MLYVRDYWIVMYRKLKSNRWHWHYRWEKGWYGRPHTLRVHQKYVVRCWPYYNHSSRNSFENGAHSLPNKTSGDYQNINHHCQNQEIMHIVELQSVSLEPKKELITSPTITQPRAIMKNIADRTHSRSSSALLETGGLWIPHKFTMQDTLKHVQCPIIAPLLVSEIFKNSKWILILTMPPHRLYDANHKFCSPQRNKSASRNAYLYGIMPYK